MSQAIKISLLPSFTLFPSVKANRWFLLYCRTVRTRQGKFNKLVRVQIQFTRARAGGFVIWWSVLSAAPMCLAGIGPHPSWLWLLHCNCLKASHTCYLSMNLQIFFFFFKEKNSTFRITGGVRSILPSLISVSLLYLQNISFEISESGHDLQWSRGIDYLLQNRYFCGWRRIRN